MIIFEKHYTSRQLLWLAFKWGVIASLLMAILVAACFGLALELAPEIK